ncbi:MFS general substrate transporter [Laetiporus sulphureus 93-53]|uniref:MFS general substrate transporter n=1 Tax=Laetiporus sulphureus 93-53 TaxID=1314785 RepID=A0A165F7S3_9APHY|nr:MFS general substrate transporter [Laetiporus sulphureus 93-53]KZT08560.1 MFS general substrate transporter [Laetiporus sulphureus 93-53]
MSMALRSAPQQPEYDSEREKECEIAIIPTSSFDSKQASELERPGWPRNPVFHVRRFFYLELYRPPAAYENAHKFDPNARWTWREETRLVRKIDCRIMIWAIIMFFCLDLDRSNLSQANTDNFLQDLHMTTDDYNLGDSLVRLCYLISELPAQVISKKVGPDIWVPCQEVVLWSLTGLGQFWLSGRSSFLATRCLLGLLQGGFVPDVILYLSYFYTTTELPIRLAWFYMSNYFAQIIGAFLATGILRLDGVGGRAGWRYLFLIEGLLTLFVGLATFLMMSPGPTQTKAWYRPNGWFTEREEIIMVNRVLRDDPTKSDMHNREGLALTRLIQILRDWKMWPLYILGFTHMIPVNPPQTYLTLSLRKLGFNTVQANLLSIPSTVIGAINLLISSYLSETINSRIGATIILQFWALPLLVALETFTKKTSDWVYYAVVTLITGFPYVVPIQVAWTSTNSASVSTRTRPTGSYASQSNIYRSDDALLYKRGNMDLIAITCMNICLYIFTFFFYRTINRRRDRIWYSMTPSEQEHYLKTTEDEGNAKLTFRFAY